MLLMLLMLLLLLFFSSKLGSDSFSRLSTFLLLCTIESNKCVWSPNQKRYLFCDFPCFCLPSIFLSSPAVSVEWSTNCRMASETSVEEKDCLTKMIDWGREKWKHRLASNTHSNTHTHTQKKPIRFVDREIFLSTIYRLIQKRVRELAVQKRHRNEENLPTKMFRIKTAINCDWRIHICGTKIGLAQICTQRAYFTHAQPMAQPIWTIRKFFGKWSGCTQKWSIALKRKQKT